MLRSAFMWNAKKVSQIFRPNLDVLWAPAICRKFQENKILRNQENALAAGHDV